MVLLSAGVLVLGLLLQGLLTSPQRTTVSSDGNGGMPVAASGGKIAEPVSPPPPGARRSLSRAEAVSVLRQGAPYNPLNHLRAGEVHRVVIDVSSPRPIGLVGYLVPTGLTAAYGRAHPNSRHFVLSQNALGGGHLAAVFVQTDGTGTPITCQVLVDGRRTVVEQTHGAYGAAVCLG